LRETAKSRNNIAPWYLIRHLPTALNAFVLRIDAVLLPSTLVSAFWSVQCYAKIPPKAHSVNMDGKGRTEPKWKNAAPGGEKSSDIDNKEIRVQS
jgi:hypothetical protein